MTVVVDDILLREPNLLTPGRKPVGIVEINYEHRLAKGLTDCYLLNYVGATRQRNLAHSTTQFGDIVGTNAWSGGNLLFDGTDDNVVIGYQSRRIENAYTLTFHGIVSNVSTDRSLVNSDRSTTADRVFMFRFDKTTGTVRFIRFNSSNGVLDNFATTETPTLGDPFIASCVFIKGIGSYIYIDGVQSAISTTYKDTVNKNTGVTTNPCRIGARMSGSTITDYLDGECFSAFIHNRGLSATEIASLHSDPYQFLIPA